MTTKNLNVLIPPCEVRFVGKKERKIPVVPKGTFNPKVTLTELLKEYNSLSFNRKFLPNANNEIAYQETLALLDTLEKSGLETVYSGSSVIEIKLSTKSSIARKKFNHVFTCICVVIGEYFSSYIDAVINLGTLGLATSEAVEYFFNAKASELSLDQPKLKKYLLEILEFKLSCF